MLFEKADVFIETGTYEGRTINEAIESGLFEEMRSIESSKEIFDNLVVKDEVNVYIHFGSSPEVLPNIINPEKSTFFFLDAHMTGDGQGNMLGKTDEQCPLLAELKVINDIAWENHAIIKIPYIIAFQPESDFWKSRAARKFDKSQWPTIDEIKAALPDWEMRDCVGGDDINSLVFELPPIAAGSNEEATEDEATEENEDQETDQ